MAATPEILRHRVAAMSPVEVQHWLCTDGFEKQAAQLPFLSGSDLVNKCWFDPHWLVRDLHMDQAVAESLLLALGVELFFSAAFNQDNNYPGVVQAKSHSGSYFVPHMGIGGEQSNFIAPEPPRHPYFIRHQPTRTQQSAYFHDDQNSISLVQKNVDAIPSAISTGMQTFSEAKSVDEDKPFIKKQLSFTFESCLGDTVVTIPKPNMVRFLDNKMNFMPAINILDIMIDLSCEIPTVQVQPNILNIRYQKGEAPIRVHLAPVGVRQEKHWPQLSITPLFLGKGTFVDLNQSSAFRDWIFSLERKMTKFHVAILFEVIPHKSFVWRITEETFSMTCRTPFPSSLRLLSRKSRKQLKE
eukprot:gene484-7867_t